MPSAIPESIKSININMSDAAAQRPVLAIEASRLFAMWANVEFMIGTMASLLIGDSAALILLDQIRARNQKLDAIRAVVADKLNHAETSGLLKPMFKLIDKAAEPRNELAHSLWGTIEQIPDGLLLTDPAAALRYSRIMLQANSNRSSGSEGPGKLHLEHQASMSNEAALKAIDILRDGTRVWRQPDFDTPRRLLGNATVALNYFTMAISGNPASTEAVEARVQLKAVLDKSAPYY